MREYTMTEFPLVITKMRLNKKGILEKMCYDFSKKMWQPIICEFQFCIGEDDVTIERIEKLLAKDCHIELPSDEKMKLDFFRNPTRYFKDNTFIVLGWLGYSEESFLIERKKWIKD